MSLDYSWRPIEYDDDAIIDNLLDVVWKKTEDGLRPFSVDFETGMEKPEIWVPQMGSQSGFLAADIFEVLYEGTRGPGKTDALIMDFFSGVGKGYGEDWRGILFRQTYPQLSDVIAKTTKWFKLMCPKAKYNQSTHTWTFPGGEQLLLRHMAKQDDYWSYHGHAYPWIGWEELCNWPDDKCYTVMMSCNRSTNPRVPKSYRSTTNPYGPGHNWVKSRFRLPQMRGQPILDSVDKEGQIEPPRMAIHGSIRENRILLDADPNYIQKVRAAARNASELAAWIEGSWDITAGGMFDDIWRDGNHIVPRFPLRMIPKGWTIDRSFDWGSSKPFSVLWWAESNGEPFEFNGRWYGKVRGDLYLIQEWYGWNGNRNEGVRMLASEVAQGIRDRQDDWEIDHRTKPGPADASIYDEENGNNIAKDMEKKGVRWAPADKSPGSRKQGWEMMRKLMKGSLPPLDNGPRENPGLFVLDWCLQFLETVPHISRDDKDLDDIDTDGEDHAADSARYRIRKKLRGVQQRGNS